VHRKEWAVVAICALLVLAAYVAWYEATASFDATPSTPFLNTSSSCSGLVPPCPAFAIDSANLTIKELEDITSQELTLRVTALGPTAVDVVSVYFSGVPLGNLSKALQPDESTTGGWAIPTTLIVSQGQTYTVMVEGLSLDPMTGRVSAEYWSSVQVVAT
jgi:hypothetical protein